MKTKLYIFALGILVLFMNEILAHKIAPTSHGSYSSGEKIVNKTIVFTGSGSYDNDSQDGGYTEKWEWAVSADGVIWGSSYMYTTSTFTYTFTTADTFYIRVRFCDNDNQWGSYYTFTIEIVDCKRYYYVKDHLGNIRQTVDENGVIISAQDYSPYGEIIRSYNNADANDKYKFTEKERDKETNLDYFGARYYDPTIGRWNSIDRFSHMYPSLSPYNYTACNPLNFIDINGDSIWVENGDEKVYYTYGMKYKGKNKTISSLINNLNSIGGLKIGSPVISRLSGSKDNYFVQQTSGHSNYNQYSNEISISQNDLNSSQHLGHELFHGYQDDMGYTCSSIYSEVEAQLYGAAIANNLNQISLPFGQSSYGSSEHEDVMNKLLYANYPSQIDLLKATMTFKSGNASNNTGVYNDFPLFRKNQINLISRFYPLSR